MGIDDGFERALAALLDGTPLPESDESALAEPLRLIQAVAAAHQQLMAPAGTVPAAGDTATDESWGHLQLREPLGRGVSATVYRAWDPRLGRDVALKLFDAETGGDLDALREGQRLASLRHPHLVTVHGADTFDGLSGMWMELIHGETIDQIVTTSGPMSVESALVAGRDVASALAVLHDRDLLHRDVKARNVVRERGGRAVLMDLGAGLDAAHVSTGPAQGTPLYMAPEVLDGAAASMSSDVYALGVLLHFMLTGSYPVSATSLPELIAHHRQGARVRLAAAVPALAPDVTTLIDACCSPQPSARPPSARRVEEACAAALARLGAAARPIPSRVERIWARVSRPLAAVGAALGAGAVVLFAGWDSAPIRDARWTAGLGAPSSPLYLTTHGLIEKLDGGHLVAVRANPPGASPLAVATSDGLIATMVGTPPFEQGGQVVPIDGGLEQAVPTGAAVCCFTDGTTDGRYNYAMRRDDTRSPGARVLAPAALFRFSRTWSNPERLFELAPGPDYWGVTFVPHLDVFVVSSVPRGGGSSRLEVWSRQGQRERVLLEVPYWLLGVAWDPADRTIWAVTDMRGRRGTTLLVSDLDGHILGTHVPDPSSSVASTTIEFPLPDVDTPWARFRRHLRGLWR